MEKPSEPSSPISALYCASEFPHPDEDAFSDNKSPVSSEFPKSSCPQPTTTPLEPPPDGGLLAWTQVFCAFLVFVNTWGFVNSFGAFQAYYTSILPQAPSTISWIGSVQTCLMFFLGTFSGRALDAGYFHFTVIVGIVVQCVGIFTMSLARNYWQLLLTHGFATGVGGGIFFTPVMGLVSTYFARKRGMALGIVTCGNSAGGIIYPLVIRQLLPQIGFAWTVRVLGFINVVCLGVVIAFMKPRLAPRKAGPLIDMDAFHDLPYVLWALAICFLMAPMYLVFYYIATFARDIIGLDYTASLNLVIVLNGIGIPARILPGFIADTYFGVLNTFMCCVLINIVVFYSWLAIKTTAAFYVFCVIFGLSSAAYQSLFVPTLTALGDDITKTGTRIGMAFTVISISALVGGPISGALIKANGGNYTGAIVWGATSMIMGFGVMVVARGIKFGWRWRIRC